jgi:hypothetical protein
MPAQPVFVLHHFWAAVSVYDCIIPSRDDFAVLRFGGIPIGSDVALKALENQERLIAAGDIFPMRIYPREMTLDNSVQSFILEYSR